MKKTLLILSGIITCTVVALISCNNAQSENKNKATISKDSLVKRGDYLVSVMGCDDCHTPLKMGERGPEPDMDRRLSGHPSQVPLPKFDSTTTKNYVLFHMAGTAMIGPWGTSFSANISSDSTGIGGWSEAQFKKVMTEGKLKGLEGTRQILPPMPWLSYKNLTDEDISAIFAFLKSTRPVNNVVPQPIAPKDVASYYR